jgi:hypothetical protein
MNSKKILSSGVAVFVAVMALVPSARAATSIQVGASGKTYASSGVQCALNPIIGMAPVVKAGLYNPKNNASATVLLNGNPEATVTFFTPDADVWLANGPNTVVVTLNKKQTDTYTFDASPNVQSNGGGVTPNICIPDTTVNTVSGDIEYAASGKSYAAVAQGCALNPSTGEVQPFINLFDNGSYVLNVSVNGNPLTQLSTSRSHTLVFLSAGLNVILAANGSLPTDYYVRNGGDGTCSLP